jgi:hypothetical protein
MGLLLSCGLEVCEGPAALEFEEDGFMNSSKRSKCQGLYGLSYVISKPLLVNQRLRLMF